MSFNLKKRLKDAYLHGKAKDILSVPRKHLGIEKGRVALKKEKSKLIPRKRLAIEKGKVVLKKPREPKFERKKLKDARTKWVKGTKRTAVIKRVTKGGGVRPWRGPYPSPLGDDLILGMELKKPLEISQANETLITTINTIYERLRTYILEIIDRYVPEDTGDLKNSLKHSISRTYSEVPERGEKKPILNIWIHSKLPYAGLVNQMPTYGSPHVRHPPYSGNYRIGRSGKILNDPTAIGNFYNFILMNARTRAKKIVEEELKILAQYMDSLSQIRITYQYVKNLFQVKFK